MHIIFDDAANELRNSYTVLELDTFRVPSANKLTTAYCVVEVIPLSEFPLADAHKKIHADLIEAYKNKHWVYCKQAIEGLTGKWNGELDTFYSSILGRVLDHETNGVADDWDGILVRS